MPNRDKVVSALTWKELNISHQTGKRGPYGLEPVLIDKDGNEISDEKYQETWSKMDRIYVTIFEQMDYFRIMYDLESFLAKILRTEDIPDPVDGQIAAFASELDELMGSWESKRVLSKGFKEAFLTTDTGAIHLDRKLPYEEFMKKDFYEKPRNDEKL